MIIADTRGKYIVRRTTEVFVHWKEKWSHFDLKSWVTGGTKIRPGIPSNWRILESNWLNIESQIINLTQIFLQLLGIPGRILVSPLTQLFRSKWLHFFSLHCKKTLQLPAVALDPSCTNKFYSKKKTRGFLRGQIFTWNNCPVYSMSGSKLSCTRDVSSNQIDRHIDGHFLIKWPMSGRINLKNI